MEAKQISMQLKSFIIEDELNSINTLKSFLREFCPNVNNIGAAVSIQDAVPVIRQMRPDLVFLDIELPYENGFKILDYFPQPFFDIVFTTAYDQYAVKAFRLAAVDYLLKPIDINQLVEAISKVIKKRTQIRTPELYSLLAENYASQEVKKIALPNQKGFSFVKINDIIYCEASRSYAFFHLKSGEKLMVSKPLKWFEETLDKLTFFRVNRSFLINLKYVQSYSRSHGGEVTLETGAQFAVSENKREALLRKIGLI